MGDIRDARKSDRQAADGWSGNDAPLVGHFFRDPAQGAMINAIRDNNQHQSAYRDVQQEGMQNALNNQMGLYQPYNAAIGRMYGADAMQSFDNSAFAPVVTNDMRNVGMAGGPGGGGLADTAGPAVGGAGQRPWTWTKQPDPGPFVDQWKDVETLPMDPNVPLSSAAQDESEAYDAAVKASTGKNPKFRTSKEENRSLRKEKRTRVRKRRKERRQNRRSKRQQRRADRKERRKG